MPSISKDELASLEGMARVLTESGLYRVARQFHRRERYEPADGTTVRRAAFVDVETTGTDPQHDAIIELAIVPFEYAPSDGRIFGVGPAISYLEDPGRPIPASIVEMTGITDAMVRGHRIDSDAIGALIPTVSLFIAHNAGFDRKFVERRLPAFVDTPWACSLQEIPWKSHGCGSGALEFIVYKLCAEFFDGHRATDDCYAAIHALATPTAVGERPLRLLLESARKPRTRLWAANSPFEAKDVLKARRYKWHGGDDTRQKCWYIDVEEDAADGECAWLAAEVYMERSCSPVREPMTARRRYSVRA